MAMLARPVKAGEEETPPVPPEPGATAPEPAPPEVEPAPPVPPPPAEPKVEAEKPPAPPPKPGPREMTPQEAAALRAKLREVTDRLYRDAKTFFWQDEWDHCIAVCDEILKRDSSHLPAQKLKFEAERAKIDHRLKMLEQESKTRDASAIADVDEASNFPLKRLPLIRPVKPEPVSTLPLRAGKPPKTEKMLAMEQKLNQRVDLNLLEVDLSYLFVVLQRIAGVNIVADEESLKDKKLMIVVENMPLKEILKFVVRKFDDIAYTVTEEAIWITKKGSVTPGMEPRIHGLNIGLTKSTPMVAAQQQQQQRPIPGQPAIPGVIPGQPNQQQQQQEKTYLEEVIEWMEGWPDWPDGTEWHIDKLSSSLMVYTTPEMHDKLADMLEMMDRPPLQVLISTRFITISVDDLADIGLDFQLNTKPGQDVVLGVGSGTDLGVTGGTGLTAIVQGQDTDPLFTATLRAMQQKGRSKILSAPQILTLNNQKGVIDITTSFNYVSDWREVETIDVTTEGNQITRVTNYVPVMAQQQIGFRLDVTPSVGRDLKHIILELEPRIVDVEGGTAQFGTVQVLQLREDEPAPPVPQPIVSTQTLRSRMVVNDGDLVIIGGLLTQETTKTTTKVPVLGDIPLLGALFRRQADTVGKSHLVIVVKAQVIHPSGRDYTDGNGLNGTEANSGRNRPAQGPWFGYPEPGTVTERR